MNEEGKSELKRWAERAVAAEKRVAELDKTLIDQREEYRHKREAATERLAAKVAELQALADALQWLQEATSDVDGGINGLRFIPAHVSCGVLIPGKWHVKRRDSSSAGWGETIVQAIALARDLAAKEKEPT